MDLAEGDGERCPCVEMTADDPGEVGDHVACGLDDVDCLVRARGMASRAFQQDREAIGRRRDRPRLRPDQAGLQVGVDMEGDDRLGSLDEAIGHDFVGASGKHLLGGLEQETHPPVASDLRPGEGETEGDGGMGVMPACVHHPLDLGREGEASGLGDREGVEVRPEDDQRPLAADVDRQSRLGCPKSGVQARLAEPCGEQVGGGVLVFGEFRMAMDGTANFHHCGKDAVHHACGVEHEPVRVPAASRPDQAATPAGSSLSPVAESRRTRTSSFGSSRRESHDATAFYERFEPPLISKDADVHWDKALDSIVLGDARNMTVVPSNSVALVVTSPPYFAGKEYEEDMGKGHVPASYHAYLAGLEDVFAECMRTLEPGGRIAVNVANLGRRPYRSLSGDIVRIFERLGLLLRGEVVWVKARGASGSTAWGTFQRPANPVLRDLTERIVIASKGRFDRAVSVRQRAESGHPHVSDIWRDEFMEATTDVWEIPSESATRVNHPAPFPVELPRRLIELFTYQGDLVLDPYMGSGTTAVAAVQSGRHFVGYEIDPDYHARALARVAEASRDATPSPVNPSETETALSSTAAAVRDGRAVRDLAAAVLSDAGFTDIRDGVKVGPGIDVTFEASDAAGRRWLFDLFGGFTASAPGLSRNDVLWRALGRAAVVDRHRQGRLLVVLTSHLPPERSALVRVLGEMVGPDGPIFDVIRLLDSDDMNRLAGYARG